MHHDLKNYDAGIYAPPGTSAESNSRWEASFGLMIRAEPTWLDDS